MNRSTLRIIGWSAATFVALRLIEGALEEHADFALADIIPSKASGSEGGAA